MLFKRCAAPSSLESVPLFATNASCCYVMQTPAAPDFPRTMGSVAPPFFPFCYGPRCRLPRGSGFVCATQPLGTYHVPCGAPSARIFVPVSQLRYADRCVVGEQSCLILLSNRQEARCSRHSKSAKSRSTEEVWSWLSIFAAWFLGRCLCRDALDTFCCGRRFCFSAGKEPLDLNDEVCVFDSAP